MMPPASSFASPQSADTVGAFDVIALPAFSDNYIWMLVPRSSPIDPSKRPNNAQAPASTEADLADLAAAMVGVTVVDPGQAAPVIAHLRANRQFLSAILLTHHHADHVGGVPELLAYTEQQIRNGEAPALPPIYGPAGEAIATVTQPVTGGDTVETTSPRAHFTVIDVPGHTRAHIAFFEAGVDTDDPGVDATHADVLHTNGQASTAVAVPASIGQNRPPRVFCGDTLFATGCGRLFEGTPAQMLASLDRLAALPDATLVHCAHEYTASNVRFARAADPHNADLLAWSAQVDALRAEGKSTVPTTLAHERRVNPFLRADAASIAPQLRKAMHEAGGDEANAAPLSRLASFTQLRAWKDRF
jgi:hydroxyacylglutathione hydrolase